MDIPQTGWIDERVEDMKNREIPCQHCGKESVRFVHVLTNPNYKEEYRVGCVCAEKLTGDPEGVREKERARRALAQKNEYWKKKLENEKPWEEARKRFMESFRSIGGKLENWYKGNLDGKICCLIWRGPYTWAFGVAEGMDHKFTKNEWNWLDAAGYKMNDMETAKEAAWQHISRNREMYRLVEPIQETLFPKSIDMLRIYMEERKLSQSDIATRLGVSASCVSRWMTGTKPPTSKMEECILRLCKGEKEEKKTSKIQTASLAETMKELATAFPELGIDPEKAYTLGLISIRSDEAGLELLKMSGYEYCKELEDEPGYDSTMLRLMRFAQKYST